MDAAILDWVITDFGYLDLHSNWQFVLFEILMEENQISQYFQAIIFDPGKSKLVNYSWNNM